MINENITPTASSVKLKLTNLLSKINTETQQNDSTLNQAVNTLIANQGINPSGTIEIKDNGEYNVRDYELANVNITTTDSALPIEISTEEEMNKLLNEEFIDNIGGIYKYIGETTDTYEKNSLYVLENIEIIKFTIAGIEYEAENNMNWQDWCFSHYNINNFYIGKNELVYFIDKAITNIEVDAELSNAINKNEKIIKDGTYYLNNLEGYWVYVRMDLGTDTTGTVEIYDDNKFIKLLEEDGSSYEAYIKSGYIQIIFENSGDYLHEKITDYGTNINYLESNKYTITGPAAIFCYGASCFVKGTLITLSNGNVKPVENITYDDELLVWDFYNGEYTIAKPNWIMIPKVANQYKLVTLSNGIKMRLVGSGNNCHRLFNMTKQKMLYANECIGDEVFTEFGVATVISCEIINEIVNYYNLTTDKHYCCFAEGVLTGSRLNNMYHISNMKYDSNERLISDAEVAERWAIRESMRLLV